MLSASRNRFANSSDSERGDSIMNWLENILAEGEHATRLRNDLEYFAQHCLKLRPKSGPLEPFVFNAAQRKLHELLEKQKASTGRVRVVILKARQLGVSTYIAARLYQRTIRRCSYPPTVECRRAWIRGTASQSQRGAMISSTLLSIA